MKIKKTYNPNIIKLRTIDYRIPFSCKNIKTFKNNYGKSKANVKNIMKMNILSKYSYNKNSIHNLLILFCYF